MNPKFNLIDQVNLLIEEVHNEFESYYFSFEYSFNLIHMIDTYHDNMFYNHEN